MTSANLSKEGEKVSGGHPLVSLHLPLLLLQLLLPLLLTTLLLLVGMIHVIQYVNAGSTCYVQTIQENCHTTPGVQR